MTASFQPEFLFIQHDASCPPQLGVKTLQSRNIDFRIAYANFPNAFAKIEPSMFKGIVVLGGHMSAYDDDKLPWLKVLKSFLKRALDQNVPILGLCLGAQLLANIVGGSNFVGKKGGEFGYYAAKWTEHASDDEFCKYIRANNLHLTMPYTHNDTFSLPASNAYTTASGHRLDIKLLASTSYPAIFKVGELSYGIQAHPEADFELHNTWIGIDSETMWKLNINPDILSNDSKAQMALQDRNGCLLHAKWFDMCLEKAAKKRRSKL